LACKCIGLCTKECIRGRKGGRKKEGKIEETKNKWMYRKKVNGS
jgi:hypothetical protein